MAGPGVVLSGDPWSSIGGSVLGSAASAAVPGLGWVTTGLSVLDGVSKVFGGGKTKVDNSTSAAYSGMGGFSPVSNISYSKPFIDLENPVHVLVAGGFLIAGILAYKRFK